MSRLGSLALAGFFCVVLGASSAADAKGLFIFNWGEDMFEVGEFPAEMVTSEGVKAGYKCQVLGLFWAYFHWWDCQPVAFMGDSYDDSPELANYVRENFKESDVKLGAWQRHGRWLFAGILLLFIGFGVFAAMDDDEEHVAVYSDDDEEEA